MQLATVVGHATATMKHPTIEGWRLLLVQATNAAGGADGDPQLAIDQQGARCGDTVMLTSDGKAVREMVGSKNCPVRWAVIGITDS